LKKIKLPEKFELLAEGGFEVKEKRRADPCSLVNPYSKTEHDVYDMEYFHWPDWTVFLAMLPSSSSTSAH